MGNGSDMRAAGVDKPLRNGDHRRSIIIAWLSPARVAANLAG
jgi:hypothetical protein